MIFTANNSLKYTNSQLSNPTRPEKRFNVRNLPSNLNINSGSNFEKVENNYEENTISSKCPKPNETSTTTDKAFKNSMNSLGKGGVDILNTSIDQQDD